MIEVICHINLADLMAEVMIILAIVRKSEPPHPKG